MRYRRAVIYSALLCSLWSSLAFGQELIKAARADGVQIPMRVYSPSTEGCAAIAIISPGAGGSEDGYSYLAKGLQEDGWRAIVIGHQESGRAALRSDIRQDHGIRSGLETLVDDPKAYKARLMDIGAALKWASSSCKAPFVALLGHSMGARTVMVEAGAKNNLGVKGENRFDAYVALSPDGPGKMFPDDAWNGLHKPMLLMTGTRDKSLDGDWKSRTIPYDRMPAGCKWLGVVSEASHMNFAGVGFAASTEKAVLIESKAFLDALRGGKCGNPVQVDGVIMKRK